MCKPAGYKLLLEMVHLLEIVAALVVPRSKLSIVNRFSVSDEHVHGHTILGMCIIATFVSCSYICVN